VVAFPSPQKAPIAFDCGTGIFFAKDCPFSLFSSSLSSSFLFSSSSLSSSFYHHSVVIQNGSSPLLSFAGDYEVLELVAVLVIFGRTRGPLSLVARGAVIS